MLHNRLVTGHSNCGLCLGVTDFIWLNHCWPSHITVNAALSFPGLWDWRSANFVHRQAQQKVAVWMLKKKVQQSDNVHSEMTNLSASRDFSVPFLLSNAFNISCCISPLWNMLPINRQACLYGRIVFTGFFSSMWWTIICQTFNCADCPTNTVALNSSWKKSEEHH